MKKKSIILLIAVVFLSIAITGTIAYFSKEFVSDKNVATAATFEVDVVNAEGETIGDAEFDLGDDLYPGMSSTEVYRFDVDRKDTSVPVEYAIQLIAGGELFPADGDSPVKLTIQRMMGDGWVDVTDPFKPENDVETIRVLVDWPHSDRDIEYQGKEGNIRLDVVATQLDYNDSEEAQAMYEEAKTELEALDNVNSSFNRGNFSKDQSDAVQVLIDELLEYADGLPNKAKTELLEKANALQAELDEKVASRYVYYEVVEEETHFEQLKLNISADVVPGQSERTQNNNPMYVNGMGEDNALYLKYSNFSFVKPVEGDKVTLNLRFYGNVKNIDATFTNLGDGNWKVESDWLVEKE